VKTKDAEAIVSKYNLATQQLAEDKAALQRYFQMQSIPLEERKQLYDITPSVLQEYDGFVFHPPKYTDRFGEYEWYDEDYARREVVNGTDVLIGLEENCQYNHKSGEVAIECDCDERVKLLEEDFIDAGIFGFTYDW
jgi:hypothetical protein